MARAYRDFTSLLLALGMVFVSTLGTSTGTDWTKLNEEYEKKIQPLIVKYCSGCHSGAEAESGLAFNNFADAKSVFRQRRVWEKVAVRIDIEDMPPADSPQPSPAERKTLTSWIQSTLNDIDCGKTPNPGSVTLRRINRYEYRNSIRDLFNIDYEPALGFPGDDVGYGFRNNYCYFELT